jgi:hypothetical protein
MGSLFEFMFGADGRPQIEFNGPNSLLEVVRRR